MTEEKTIKDELFKFEVDTGKEIILAVESGSRGWGFSSEDSDYDVRFVYKSQYSNYLHLRKPRDSVNWMRETPKIDYEGFDVYKFYDLLLKSNMNIIDWLFQKNIYFDYFKDKERLKEIVSKNFNRNTYISHNYGLCSKNYHKYFEIKKENEPTAKRYVYCIRALLSAQYCAETGNLAPLNFYDLLAGVNIPTKERDMIYELIEIKKKTKERKWYKDSFWDDWIRQRLNGNHLRSEIEQDYEAYYMQLNQQILNEIEKRD